MSSVRGKENPRRSLTGVIIVMPMAKLVSNQLLQHHMENLTPIYKVPLSFVESKAGSTLPSLLEYFWHLHSNCYQRPSLSDLTLWQVD